MKTLFGIQAEYLEALDMLEENGGELTDEINERLNINKNELEDKFKAYHHVITMKEGEMSTIDAEIERLKALRSTKATTVERLKEMLLNAVILYGDEGKSGNHTLEFDTLKVHTRKSTRIEADLEKLEERFISAVLPKITLEQARGIAAQLGISYEDLKLAADKTAIKTEMGLGEIVEGAESVTEEKTIIFK